MRGGFWLKRAARAAVTRANLANAERRYTDAAADYRRYLAWKPDHFEIWVQLGHMLGEAGDHRAAESAYAMADGLRPDDADLLLCWGHLRRRMGDEPGARDFYARSIAIDGNADALRCHAELTPPEPENEPVVADEVAMPVAEDEPVEIDAVVPEAEPEPEPHEPPFAGLIEHVEGRTIAGYALFGPGCVQEDIEFRRDGERIGHAVLIHRRDEASFLFRTMLPITGEALVSAHRRSDGAELHGSPVVMAAPAPPAPPPELAWAAPCEVVKPFVLPLGEVALLVSHSATGLLKPHVLPYIRALADRGIATLLIVSVDHPIALPPEVVEAAAGVIVRANRGYDFGGWAQALKRYPELYSVETLYLLNDSVFGPASDAAFDALITRVRRSDADLIGLTESNEHAWHLQSYFMAVRQSLLATLLFQNFFGNIRVLDHKDEVIRAYEVPFARAVRGDGFKVDVLFKVPLAINPTLFAWQPLLEQGFPFLKLLLLRGVFREADITGWREAAAAHGFDVPLLDMTVRAATEVLPQGPQGGLLAETAGGARDVNRPLKVALFGPWNYDSGLGSASRGLIAAVRRTGVRLNLHPIKKPFHIHRPLVADADLIDFEGPADIALVHLNPDSWHLLTDEQRALIAAATKRIGYWVWEMGHLPDAWWTNFRSVDRIWAPSRYCAKLFEQHATVPVDVVPHAVPVLPHHAESDTARIRAELGLAPGERSILYVFDGASYLVRKNPAALARAFAASGLAERGWRLILKTKYLMDRVEEGARLRALADTIDGVRLIDRPLSATAFQAMIDAADIYASPHCSEGFGLTIAEAMASGKPVVATDFGGSRDYLDAASGFPVKAHAWVLDEDFGHYTSGGEWARIDEPALAATLVRVAEQVMAGDTAVGEAARAQIATLLSYDRVGGTIAGSFAATLAPLRKAQTSDRPEPRMIPPDGPRFHSGLRAALPLDRVDFGPRFAVVALKADGSAPDEVPAFDADFTATRDTWIVLAPEGARIHPLLPMLVEAQADRRPDVAIFYGDDVAEETPRAIDQLRLKPSFDLTLLTAQDYIGAPLIVRATAWAALEGVRRDAGSAATVDLVLRAHGAGLSIDRIPEVLLAQEGARVHARVEDHARVLAAMPYLADYEIAAGRVAGTLMLRRDFARTGHPPVTLIIPTCRSLTPDGRRPFVAQLLDKLAETDWPMDRLTVLVGDDIAGTPDWATAARPYAFRRIETLRPDDEPFSYSNKMNYLWRLAETEHLVFLNDDVLPIGAGWLKALMTFAVDDGVGGVGARLLYEDGRLQHAGIVPHQTAVTHAWLMRTAEAGSYQDWADVHREWSMVTGAVFATRRTLMDELSGFEAEFTVEYNDVDLALRLRALGYRLVYTADAELFHIEKASRGHQPPRGDQLARFCERWRSWLDNDPSWHPGLRGDTIDVTPYIAPDAWYRA